MNTKDHTELLSRHAIGEPVYVYINNHKIEGNIRVVLFSNMKVRYSVSVLNEGSRTTLHNLDSIVVKDRDGGDWINFGDDNYS